MIFVVKIQGGLGNQLYTYAFGQALRYAHPEAQVYYDISSYDSFYMPYVLYKFNLKHMQIVPDGLLKWKPNSVFNRLKKHFLKSYNPIHNFIYYKNRGNRFNPEALKITENTYFDGYWESEEYFNDIKEDLKEEFTLALGFDADSLVFLDKIKSADNPIAVHVRRGDKAFIKNINAVLGVDSLDYYKRAVAKMEDTLRVKSAEAADSTVKKENFSYFIFSDDMPWVKKNLKISGEVCFVDKKLDDEEEFMLMMECPNKIIASSSYSWWAAILGECNGFQGVIISPNKYAVTLDVEPAPKRWISIDR